VDVLAHLDVNLGQGSACVEVDGDVGPRGDVSAARRCRLHDALLRGDHLSGGPRCARGRAHLRGGQECHAECGQAQKVEMPRMVPTRAGPRPGGHRWPPSVVG